MSDVEKLLFCPVPFSLSYVSTAEKGKTKIAKIREQ